MIFIITGPSGVGKNTIITSSRIILTFIFQLLIQQDRKETMKQKVKITILLPINNLMI